VRALLHRALTLATFLDAPEQALAEYRQIQQDFPQHAEVSHYREGLLLFDLGRYRDAVVSLQRYLRDYAKGQFSVQAEVLLERARAEAARAVPPAPAPAPHMVKLPQVRVLLVRRANTIEVAGEKLRLRAGQRELQAGEHAQLTTDGGQIVALDGQALGTEVRVTAASPIRLNAGKTRKIIRDELVVTAIDGQLRVINHIGIESYLRGVVPAESYASWPEEALKAQAVAARTYVLYQIHHRRDRAYDVVDHEGDQAYKGVEREHPRTDKAVAATRGEILVEASAGAEASPVLAMYSANSGGHTADAKAIFRVDNAVLNARVDPWSLDGAMSSWTRRFTRSEVEQRLARVGVRVQRLQAIEPVARGPSGRLIRVRLVHEGSPIVVRARPVLTRSLKLPEILVEISRKNDEFVFNGRGWGHGVGYSQWGGAGMAKAEKDYQQILAYYYSGVRLERFW
jgi:stage II sporulation protein D